MIDRLFNNNAPSSAMRGVRLFRKSLVVLTATTMLAGCVTTGAEKGTLAETQVATSNVTIDPSYTLPPELTEGPVSPTPEAELRYVRSAAKIAMESGQVAGAAVHLSRLYDESPRDKRVIYDYARHLRYVNALNEAQLVLNDGLALYPDDPLLRLESAKTAIALANPDEALVTLKALRQTHPNDPSILQMVGVAHDRKGEHDVAMQAYEAAMAIGRPTAPLLNNAAMSRLMAGDLDRAEALLRDALAAPGASPQVRQNLALTLTLKGDEEAARQVSAQALPEPLAEKAVAAYSAIARAAHPWQRLAD